MATEAKEKKPSIFMRVPKSIMAPRLVFIASVILLCIIGLVMVYSASSIKAYTSNDGDALFYIKRQMIFFAIGIVLAIICIVIPEKLLSFWAADLALCIFTSACMVAVIFVGVEALGASRTLVFGSFSFQPAEFAKITTILLFCSLYANKKAGKIQDLQFGICSIIIIALTGFLIVKQPDLGTALIMFVAVLAICVLAEMKWKTIAIILAIVFAFALVVCFTQDYHLDRITAMLDPYADADGSGFQLIRSLYAFGTGGFSGSGLGLSRQKYSYLPEAHTDFIFSIIGEEGGFILCMIVIVLFIAFLWAGLSIAKKSSSYFGALLAGGLSVMVTFQACVNMLCVLGAAPITGKPLPFISYGGSSLIASLAIVGLILNVSFHTNPDDPYSRNRDNFVVIRNNKRSNSNHGSDNNLYDRHNNAKLNNNNSGENRPQMKVIRGGTASSFSSIKSRSDLSDGLGARANRSRTDSKRPHVSATSDHEKHNFENDSNQQNRRDKNAHSHTGTGRLSYRDAMRRKSSKDTTEPTKPR